ncbi:MAG TPA: DUF5916 domain-containing protein [Chitinophagaceae bacterium]
MKKLFFILLLFDLLSAYSQNNPKQVPAVRTALPIKIDGLINEDAWKQAPPITGLVEMRPTPGKAEAEKSKTEVYLLYDNAAVYFGGILHESNKDSISTQLSGRDGVGVNDFIGVVFDTYQDKINGLGFYVTPLNEQFDIRYTIGMNNNGEDLSWNAVYSTATNITGGGWSFEMRIPYSALRFSKEKLQNWGLHIIRRRAKTGQQYSWSPIDPTKFGFMNQAGVWTGLQDIKPPVRLSFSPYFSIYQARNPDVSKEWKTSVNGGVDVKYGISDGFTMDMTLIPDFGQVQSDNQILNLSPFEVKFNENRPFFNEGVELFNRANLFYSRRIGGLPIHYYDAYNAIGLNETILKNPVESKLINATKISGRTKKKLGLGFFNAITKAQYATVDDGNGNKYALLTDPLTNYNILVIDQGLKNNSRVTLINTNVLRSGHDYDANVTAVDWDLYDNKVDWNFWGQVNYSRLMGYPAIGRSQGGYLYNLYLGKFRGRFNFEVHRFYADDQYEQSDMGYFTNNNYITHGFYAGYKWVKPKYFYNSIYLNLNGNYTQHYLPRSYQDARINMNINSQLKSLWTVSFSNMLLARRNDFYEPRLSGRMVKMPGAWQKGFSVTTNSAKKYSAFFQFNHTGFKKYKTNNYNVSVGNNYRFNDKLSIGLNHYLTFNDRDFGFAYITDNADSVVMSLRRRRTAENIFNVKYNFNNRMALTFRLRHYWSKVNYSDFANLKPDGNTEPLALAGKDPDINVNLFNIDMNYTWQFGPGSFINVNWKTATELYDQFVLNRYYYNLKKTLDSPQRISFSVKVIYYLDYLSLKGKGKKEKSL